MTSLTGGISIFDMDEGKKPLPQGVSASLLALEGPGEGERFVLASTPCVIGRGEKADLRVDGVGVAERHALLTFHNDSLFIEDLGSGGVTRVNERMASSQKLINGDIVEIGEGKLLVQFSSLKLGDEASDPAMAPREAAGERNNDEKRAAVWSAGFYPEFREWMRTDVGPELGVEVETFRTGEEILAAASGAMFKDRPPSIILLDLRLPLVNGINVAIAIRAYELGYKKNQRVNLAFVFNPPDSASFDKVIKFCQPVSLVVPGQDHAGLTNAVMKAVEKNFQTSPTKAG